MNQKEWEIFEALKKPKYDFDVARQVLIQSKSSYERGYENGYKESSFYYSLLFCMARVI